jgi:hypothetical protein
MQETFSRMTVLELELSEEMFIGHQTTAASAVIDTRAAVTHLIRTRMCRITIAHLLVVGNLTPLVARRADELTCQNCLSKLVLELVATAWLLLLLLLHELAPRLFQ